MAKLIVGCGYLGQRVAQQWLEQGEQVYAVTRSSLRANELAAMRLEPIVANVIDKPSLAQLPEVDAVLYAVGYDRSSEESMQQIYVAGLKNVLDSLSAKLEKLIYVSSTGVYGQQEGQVVDESSPCNPTREGGKICFEAENVLREHELGKRSIILRLAGIYGPDRVPRQQQIMAGESLAIPPEGEMNLIHVEDAAQIAVEFAAEAVAPDLFCVSDGQPVERRDYYSYLAQLLQAPQPKFVKPEADEQVSQRARSSKRVDSSKLHAKLGRPLQYPSYREGLAASIEV